MLVVCGEDDFWVPKALVEEMVKLLKNAAVAYLKGVGHYPMFEVPWLTAKLANDFCRKHLILK